MRSIVLPLLIVTSCCATFWAKVELRYLHSVGISHNERPPLYLPEANKVRLVTLGFNNLASDILWFSTVNYFGKQYLGDKDYRWLNHMCRLVTSLDRNALHVYEFCGTLLSWIAKEPEMSNNILDDAILHHPNNWRFLYLKGFNYWYFLEEPENARDVFERAARLPNAPPFLGSLASRLIAKTENPSTAVSFLNDLINHTSNQAARDALTDKLKRAILTRDIWNLNRLVQSFRESAGRYPENLKELVAARLLKEIPQEPFGGRYLVDSASGNVTTSSGEKGLEFSGKTARTGIFKNEFTVPPQEPQSANE